MAHCGITYAFNRVPSFTIEHPSEFEVKLVYEDRSLNGESVHWQGPGWYGFSCETFLGEPLCYWTPMDCSGRDMSDLEQRDQCRRSYEVSHIRYIGQLPEKEG